MDTKEAMLYLECLSGISGDMFVAALLDLGADADVLKKVLETVPAKGFSINISRVKKAGLDVCDFDVILSGQYENHDHDMQYLYGKEIQNTTLTDHEHHHEEHSHEHHHHGEEHSGEHGHEHHHEEHSHEHHHEHRGLQDVLEIIEATQMSEHAKELAVRIFTILGKAEAKAHGTSLEEVHFHEVGAIDSIVDIIAASVCLDNLGIEKVIIPVLHEGTGKIRCQHGILPVPVPAVAAIIAENHLTLHITDMEAELVTPTGAAIAAAIQTDRQLPEHFTIEKIGIGAGKREYKNPSLLRAMLIRQQPMQEDKSVDFRDKIYKLESNIDDCTGENFGFVMDRLLEAGAKDVNYMPVYMKKNRPAYQLNVICAPDDVKKMENIIFTQTTTIGIRRTAMERSILKREMADIKTPWGIARVKICEWDQDGTNMKKIYPEYESVVSICKDTGKSFHEIFHMIETIAQEYDK